MVVLSHMNQIQAIVLGIVQGFTEFLPISSSAHLVLVPHFFYWQDPGLAYDVALHMGTLAAILVFFHRDWLQISKDTLGLLSQKRPSSEVQIQHLIVGCVPAAVAGVLLGEHAETTFRNPLLIAFTLASFGLLLWHFDRNGRKRDGLQALTLKHAAIIGCAQAFAIIPGVSRSGVTITAALALGLTRPASARFSFLLSAPIIAGAGMVKSKHILEAYRSAPEIGSAMLIGFVASMVSGLAAIGLLQAIIKNRTFAPFVVYRLALALAIALSPMWAS